MKGIKLITELRDAVGQTARIAGWLQNKRSSGGVQFIIIRDGTGVLQCVGAKKDLPLETFDLIDTLPLESSLIVEGEIHEDKRARGNIELKIKRVEVVSKADQDYPIGKKEHGPDFLLSNRHLWIRSPKQAAILRIRDEFIKAIRDFFYDNGFVLTDSPIFTPAACEGTTTLFETDYLTGGKAYLSQSGQLYLEATCMALNKTYCFGPTFRAEKSKTRRHLTEFWMVEAEMAFADFEDSIRLQEELVSYAVRRILERRASELEVLERDKASLQRVSPPFPRISYDQAIKMLSDAGHKFEWGGDFGAPEETALSENFDKPFFVHRFPAGIKAFYMKRDPENPKLALGADLLAPEGYGEIVGGGEREDNLEELVKRIEEHQLPKEAFEWYLDLRRYGSVPHSGFGLGIERTLAWICGIEHVRETIPFPRTIYRIYP